MTKEEINASLDKMLADPKTKNFLNHLVRAYMPITKVNKVEEKPKGIFKCVLSKQELVCVDDILTGIETEEFKTNLMKHLQTMFDETVDSESPMRKLIGDKKLGVTGKDTTTFMAYPVFQEFYSWVVTKALKGDKHINWLLGSIKRNAFIDRAENIQDGEVQKKVANHKKQEHRGPATFTLGDLGVLQQLKEELKKNEI